MVCAVMAASKTLYLNLRGKFNLETKKTKQSEEAVDSLLQHDNHNQIDDEEQDNGRFEDEHPAVGLVVVEKLVEVVERFDFFVDVFMPFGEVKTGGDHVVDAGEMPIADEFRDVGKLVAEAGEIDADFTEKDNDLALAVGTVTDVAVGTFERAIEEAVIGLEFSKVKVGEFHHVKDLGEIVRLIDDEGGVPIGHDEIALIITDEPTGGLVRFLLGKVLWVGFLVEQSGNFAAVGVEPVFGADFCGGQEGAGFEAKNGVGFLLGEVFLRADQVRAEFDIDSLGEFTDFRVESAFAELEVVKGNEVIEAIHLEGNGDGDTDGANGKDFDNAMEFDGPKGAHAFDERKANHLRPVEEGMLGVALAGIDFELLDLLPKQFADRFGAHFVSDVEGEHVNRLAAESP